MFSSYVAFEWVFGYAFGGGAHAETHVVGLVAHFAGGKYTIGFHFDVLLGFVGATEVVCVVLVVKVAYYYYARKADAII